MPIPDDRAQTPTFIRGRQGFPEGGGGTTVSGSQKGQRVCIPQRDEGLQGLGPIPPSTINRDAPCVRSTYESRPS